MTIALATCDSALSQLRWATPVDPAALATWIMADTLLHQALLLFGSWNFVRTHLLSSESVEMPMTHLCHELRCVCLWVWVDEWVAVSVEVQRTLFGFLSTPWI